MHLLAFYKGVYQNARSSHQDSNGIVKKVCFSSVRYNQKCIQNFRGNIPLKTVLEILSMALEDK
jgi:hypothetical protein